MKSGMKFKNQVQLVARCQSSVRRTSMVSVPGGIAHGVHERLRGVHRIGALRIKAGGVEVHLCHLSRQSAIRLFFVAQTAYLHKDSGEGLREVGILACSRVGAVGKVRDMRLVVSGVGVLAIPASAERSP
jgi:hypothetical protein